MNELILAYSTSTPLIQPMTPPAAIVTTTTSGHGSTGVGEQPHRDDVHEPDIVGDREVVVAGRDHQHLGEREQRDGRVVAEDGAEGLDAGEGLRQEDRENDDQKDAEDEQAVRPTECGEASP